MAQPAWAPPAPDAGLSDWLAWADNLPLCRELGLVCRELDDERGLFTVEAVPMSANPNGSVNGGLVAALTDQAMGVMAVRGAEPGYFPATAALQTQFHSPAFAPLMLKAFVVGGGRRVRYVEVLVEDRIGNRCVTSHGTMVIGRASN